MASLFGHALAAAALGIALRRDRPVGKRYYALGVVGALLPDADVAALALGIPYRHMLGHRGLSHSLLAAALWAGVVVWLAYRDESWSSLRGRLGMAFFVMAASHGILDAFTDGGEGVALLAPFSGARFFFPWQPIQVSPIGVGAFFTAEGVSVLMSEAVWIGIPSLLLIAVVMLSRRGAPLAT